MRKWSATGHLSYKYSIALKTGFVNVPFSLKLVARSLDIKFNKISDSRSYAQISVDMYTVSTVYPQKNWYM